MSARRPLLARFGPGLLVAATGVGAGDLATAAFAGDRLGLACLWAVPLGAAFKYVLTEGVARWQLATGTTLLEGATGRLGPLARALFPLYLVPWSFFVGAALASACGVAAHALAPVFDDAATGKLVFGALHALVGLALTARGGFRLFERLMAASVGLMFVTVVATAFLLAPDLGAVAAGLFRPRLPAAGAELGWLVALVGGVGGTLTLLCYGGWMRAEAREGPGELATCRADLAVGYAVTALFGVAMVVVGSTVSAPGGGAALVVALADRLGERVGPAGRLVFLVGAWAAVFSSLLGVWQAVPKLFTEYLRGLRPEREPPARAETLYRVGLALIPLAGLALPFREVQRLYAIVGATFLPLLAVALLVLNGRRAWVGALRTRALGVAALLATLAFFVLAGALEVRERLGG